MSKEQEKCDIKVVRHPVKGVEFELRGNCADTVNLVESLPPRKQRYLMRRIVIKD